MRIAYRYLSMKFKASLILILILFGNSVFAQRTTEFGILLGRAYYLGELNPKTHWGDNVGSFAYGAVFRYNLNPRYSLKASFLRSKVSAEDQVTEFTFNNQFRKASFESTINDFSGQIEFNFMPYETGNRKAFFSPYVFLGISAYNANTSTNFEGSVQPNEEINDGIQWAFPFGPGFKLSLGQKVSLGFEWGFRKTPNDFIDGNPNRFSELFEFGKEYDKDWYVMSGFMLTYRLTRIGSCPVYNF